MRGLRSLAAITAAGLLGYTFPNNCVPRRRDDLVSTCGIVRPADINTCHKMLPEIEPTVHLR